MYACVHVFTQVLLVLSIYPTILTCCVVVLCPEAAKEIVEGKLCLFKDGQQMLNKIKLKQSKPCHTDKFVALTKGALRNCTSYVRLKRWKYLLFKCKFTYPYQPSQASLVAHSDDDCSVKPKKQNFRMWNGRHIATKWSWKHYQNVTANCKNCQNTS